MSNAKKVVADGKIIGEMINKPSDQVYFGVTVDAQRAEYLMKCLETPLCLSCRREVDECDADPCTDRRIDLGELEVCAGCKATFDPAHLTDGQCPDCRAEPQLFAVYVFETITYTAWIYARSEAEAEHAVDYMDSNDWDPIHESSGFGKYGYSVNKRSWNIGVPSKSERDLVESHDVALKASDWLDDA